jgi:hypothetical protein
MDARRGCQLPTARELRGPDHRFIAKSSHLGQQPQPGTASAFFARPRAWPLASSPCSHAFSDKNDIGNFAGSALNPERQADSFASDLILPNFLLVPRLQKIKKVTLAAARELSNEFCASLTATLLKMTLSNIFPIAIACYNKTMRRCWFEKATMIQPWWLPVQMLDPQTFAAEMLLNGTTGHNFPRKMPADSWFDFKGSDRFEVSEQSFLLPDDEILVVLTLPEGAAA